MRLTMTILVQCLQLRMLNHCIHFLSCRDALDVTIGDQMCIAQGNQGFFVAYGQNPDKKCPKWLFFENVMAKITKCFNYGNFHINWCIKLFGDSIFFVEEMWFCQRSKFLP